VRWNTDGEKDAKSFVLEWQERGGPAAGTARKQGFGTKFIERSVAYELQGSAELRFDPGGLHATIRAPLTEGEREAGAQNS